MALRVLLSPDAHELSTYRILGTITDEAGGALPAASITTLTLTLHPDETPATIINLVDEVNILNTGRGVVDSAGNLTLTLLPADNPIVNALNPDNNSMKARTAELHVATLQWTYAAGVKAGKKEIAFWVDNVVQAP